MKYLAGPILLAVFVAGACSTAGIGTASDGAILSRLSQIESGMKSLSTRVSSAESTVKTSATKVSQMESDNQLLRRQVEELSYYMYGGVGAAPGSPDSVMHYAGEGHEALSEVREVRDRIWPIFSQDQETNAAMAKCFRKTCP